MILKAQNLMKSYSGNKVVKDISLKVNQGEIVGLLGPNGAGKTTSFYMIVGLIKPNGGKIYLDNQDFNEVLSLFESTDQLTSTMLEQKADAENARIE